MAESILTTKENKNLDDFYQNILSKEPTIRLECFPALEIYLSDVNTSLECNDLTGLINGLFKWIEGSNFRIACNGLRALELFLDRLDSNEFERFLDIVVSTTVDRLGDAKDQVREAASNLLIKLMTTYNPQRIWDLMQPLSFDNKQFRIKEESQRLLIRSLNEFGASTMQLNKLVPLICKLVSDSNGTVRQQAIDTLVEIYRHVGEKVRGDIAKRDIPEAKLKQLYEKFDDVVANGRMIAKSSDITDDANQKSTTTRSRLNSDSSTTSSRSRPSTSGIPARTSTVTSSTNQRLRSSSNIPRPNSSTSTTGAAASGAVDEAIFEEAFDSTRSISISSGKEVENHLSTIRDTLADTNNDWEKRVDALKTLRSVISGDGHNYEEFTRNLRQLDLPLVATVKDLRSQIVREACITLAYMSIHLTNGFERTAESVITAMVNLIQNSAKVISTSGAVSLRYIVTNTPTVKLVPLVLAGIESKSKEIRRHTYELLVIMLSHWDLIYLDKHGQLINDSIKKGLSDADEEARSFARKSFSHFRDHFPSLAEALLATLDAKKKKTLLGGMSNASSTNSLASVGSSRIRSSKDVIPKPSKQDPSSNLSRSSSANELALRNKMSGGGGGASTSTSLNASSSQSTSRHRAIPHASNTTKPPSATPRSSKTVSQSQPGSRSTSPNSLRLSMTRTSMNSRSRIPTGSNGGSRISSRESSPGRTPVNLSGGGNRRRYGRYRGPGSDYGDHTGIRRVSGSWIGDSGDDASETSSICSERAVEDIADILRRMASNEWAERKESLVSLYHMIRSGRSLNTPELKRLTELLTKRFHDANSQVFLSFLDVLPTFIHAYKRDLNDWLYILLTRLLMRLGASELLDSTSKKLHRCLSVVDSSFDVHAQFNVLIKFINDNSLAPSVKVKEMILRYFQHVLQHMEPVDITNTTDIRTALSKIINWSGEPKSIDMRKAAQAAIYTLYNLNRPEFNLMLTTLPQSFQDTAAKIIKTAGDMQSSNHSHFDNKFDFFHRTSISSITSPMSTSMHSDIQSPSYASDMRILMENMQALNVNNHHDDVLLTNSSAIKDKPKHSMIPVRNYTPQSYRSLQSNPSQSSDTVVDTTDRPAAIDIALNMANNSTLSKEQRQHALRCLMKFARINDTETWDIAFNKTLNTLTQILDSTKDDVMYKVYSLRIIRELLIHQTSFFMNYIELIIFQILKAQSETESEVTRSAEQAAHAAAEHLPAEITFRVLKPIVEQAKYPMNQSAIAMLQKTIELMDKDLCLDLMPEMIPPLLTVWDTNSHNLSGSANSWDNETSSVRKAAVFCLVSIYLVVGEALRTHLHKLSASKLKLLNVYISKAQQQTTTSTINNTEKSTTNGTENNKAS